MAETYRYSFSPRLSQNPSALLIFAEAVQEMRAEAYHAWVMRINHPIIVASISILLVYFLAIFFAWLVVIAGISIHLVHFLAISFARLASPTQVPRFRVGIMETFRSQFEIGRSIHLRHGGAE